MAAAAARRARRGGWCSPAAVVLGRRWPLGSASSLGIGLGGAGAGGPALLRRRGSAPSRCRGCTVAGRRPRFGLLSALLAAVVPAWIASRQDVVAVLAGRRGDRALVCARRSSGWCCSGSASPVPCRRAAVGAVASRDRRLGASVAVLGMILLVPVVLVVLARGCSPAAAELRYAVRDAARHRTRTVPAVAAVAATVAGVVALGHRRHQRRGREPRRPTPPILPMGRGAISGYGVDPARWDQVTRAASAARCLPRRSRPSVGLAEDFGVGRGVTYRPASRDAGVLVRRCCSGYSSAFGSGVLVADAMPTLSDRCSPLTTTARRRARRWPRAAWWSSPTARRPRGEIVVRDASARWVAARSGGSAIDDAGDVRRSASGVDAPRPGRAVARWPRRSLAVHRPGLAAC